MDVKDIYIIVIFGLIFFGALLAFLIYIVVMYRKKQARFEKELLRSQIEIQEETFNNISQEIHDNVGQVLTVAKMHLNLAINDPSNTDVERLQDIKENVSKAMADLRDISKGLNSASISEHSLQDALQEQVSRINKTNMVRIGLSVEGNPVNLPADKKLILFRVIQECLQNIIKHSGAKHAGISLLFDTEALKAEVTDDGIGFDIQQSSTSGLGLYNIINRCSVIGAKVSIESPPPGGTVITINLPYDK